jgi:TatD DNase family protein
MTNDTTARAGSAASTAERLCFIDIGINLTHNSFVADRDAVIARAQAAGVVQMVVTGSSAASSRAAMLLAQEHPQRLFATAGVHPHHAAEWSAEVATDMARSPRMPKSSPSASAVLITTAILRRPRCSATPSSGQLELAATAGKPVFLHQRDAHADFVAILREHRSGLSGAVAHCFTGTAAELECYLEMQLFIGITGWICDERRGAHLLPLMRTIPAHQLLLETDAPYLLPRDLQPGPPRGAMSPPTCRTSRAWLRVRAARRREACAGHDCQCSAALWAS